MVPFKLSRRGCGTNWQVGDVVNGGRPDLARMASVDSADYGGGGGGGGGGGKESGIRADNFREGYAKGSSLLLVQVKGLMTKRMLQTMRNWILYSLMVS